MKAIEQKEAKAAKEIEIIFFGCTGAPGHFVYGNDLRRRDYASTPWGMNLDTGILTPGVDQYARADTTPTGNYTVSRKDGWTAIAFWDRSGDDRPGSNSAFLVSEQISDIDLLNLAAEQWPSIVMRHGFPLRSIMNPLLPSLPSVQNPPPFHSTN